MFRSLRLSLYRHPSICVLFRSRFTSYNNKQIFDCPSPKQIRVKGGKEDPDDNKDRVKSFCFPELMSCLFTVLGTNEKFSTGKSKPVRLQTFNDTCTQRVKWMKEHDKWKDQHGKIVTHFMNSRSSHSVLCFNSTTDLDENLGVPSHPGVMAFFYFLFILFFREFSCSRFLSVFSLFLLLSLPLCTHSLGSIEFNQFHQGNL